MSVQPYTREEIKSARDRRWEGFDPDGGEATRRWLATVDALEAKLLAVWNMGHTEEMEWAAKVDARNALLREALATLTVYEGYADEPGSVGQLGHRNYARRLVAKIEAALAT